MVFNSLTFAVFLAAVLGVHALPLSWTFRKGFLFAASLLFYAAWNPPFVLLILLSSVVDFYVAAAIHRSAHAPTRKGLLYLSLGLNLGLLSFFKYGGFLLDNFVAACAALGIAYQPPAFSIILPVGISFYTFQTLSYTLDIYRGTLEPRESFLDFGLFVSFFPQLVAGPIVRAADFLPQLDTPRRATPAQLGWGLTLFTIGLFEKVLIADGLMARAVDMTYRNWQDIGGMDAWVGTLAFASQIFCDFAGYSTCAIGVAMCLGFALPDNFKFPYGALGFSDFWRRWHISLSTWLRDYVYISLGGNRHGLWRTQAHLMATMLIGGLWHGASWRFVMWGFLHGAYLAGERVFQHLTRHATWTSTLPARLAGGGVTFVLVCYAWVFFRADSFEAAFRLCAAMTGMVAAAPSVLRPAESALVVLATAGLVAVHTYMRTTTVEAVAAKIPWGVRAVALAGVWVAVLLAPGDRHAFIYFQF